MQANSVFAEENRIITTSLQKAEGLIKITTSKGIATVIEVPEGESITNVIIGDSKNWHGFVEENKRYFFVNPMQNVDQNTDLFIKTDKNYIFLS